MNKHYLEKIKESLANANIADALNKLRDSFPKDSNEIVLLRSRLTELERNEIKGILDPDQISLAKNKIISNILKFIDSIAEPEREVMGTIWDERQIQNDYISKQVKFHNPKRLVVHDSFFSRNKGHKWEQGIDYCLKNGGEVILILSNPNSEVYRKRKLTLGITNLNNELPQSILQKEIDYPNTFQLFLIDELYNGPFVLIDDFKFFLGLFLPKIHSEDLPIFEFWRTSNGNNIFQSLENWIEEIIDKI